MSYWNTPAGMTRWAQRLGVTGKRFAVSNGPGGFGTGRFGVTISNVTKTFFRPELIRDPILRARSRILSNFGMYVMKDARQSIRHRKNASRPGRSPTSWNNKFNSNHNDLLKRFIFYSYEPPNNVVIGPVPLDGSISKLRIPQVLEYGGRLLNHDRFGKAITSTITERPYMHPAMERQKKKRMPMDFEGCIRR